MATYDELKELAELRLREAEALFSAGLFDGSRYLSGYVVELALKARICRLLELDEYPAKGELSKVYAVHELNQLLLLAGLKKAIHPGNAGLFANWNIAASWNAERRYDAAGSVTRQDALDTLNAIRETDDGVFTWIKTVW